MIWIHISEARRMLFRRIRVSLSGIKRYPGKPEYIAARIIEECFDRENKYFRVSSGHFCEFYARDFGWCTESLISLGYSEEVLQTLDYALSIFEKHGRIEETISPKGVPFTFPDADFSDALPFIARSLRLVGADYLVKKYKTFLNKEIKLFFDGVVDKKTGLVKKNANMSSMKDYSLRESSCYDNVMLGMLSCDLSLLRLDNPFKHYDYGKLLMRYFWTGEYFLDDLSGRKDICGDANVLPFFSRLITNKIILRKAMASLRKEGLDFPFPLKYTKGRSREQKMIFQEFFAGNYERDAIWAHVGLMYIIVISRIDASLAKKYLTEYEKKIRLHRNFLEVYDKDGEPFKTLLYYSDESMLWAANYLFLKKKLKEII